jgi:hypothetical protein
LASEEEKITTTNSKIYYSLAKVACFFDYFFGPAFSALLFDYFFGPAFPTLKIGPPFSTLKYRSFFFTLLFHLLFSDLLFQPSFFRPCFFCLAFLAQKNRSCFFGPKKLTFPPAANSPSSSAKSLSSSQLNVSLTLAVSLSHCVCDSLTSSHNVT